MNCFVIIIINGCDLCNINALSRSFATETYRETHVQFRKQDSRLEIYDDDDNDIACQLERLHYTQNSLFLIGAIREKNINEC